MSLCTPTAQVSYVGRSSVTQEENERHEQGGIGSPAAISECKSENERLDFVLNVVSVGSKFSCAQAERRNINCVCMPQLEPTGGAHSKDTRKKEVLHSNQRRSRRTLLSLSLCLAPSPSPTVSLSFSVLPLSSPSLCICSSGVCCVCLLIATEKIRNQPVCFRFDSFRMARMPYTCKIYRV